ncbi:glycosyltransferase [Microbacterium marinilacus]|uniref:Glycosyltransferase n=1 Tax=Microbacterium marinilacus TaxID=415209 RepID=A0ABP7BAU6_9MICO
MLVFPAFDENPYLNLLALAARADGFRFLGSGTYRELSERAAGLRAGDVLHVHWTTPLLQQEPSASVASRRLRGLVALLGRLRGRGVRIVWTVHNRLPHELRHPALEVRLYRALAAAADAIHVMSPATPEVVADVVTLDRQKVRVIPHPSYEGVYETGVTREAARASFGLEDDERAALFLGQIRPYKGVSELVDATALAARGDGPRLRLMLAGAVKEQSRDEFVASIPDGLPVISQLDYVADGDLARWFRAADVAVFPYRSILNSGSVHLAATFRVPVVLPDEPHLRDQFGEQAWVSFFDRRRPVESIAELLASRTAQPAPSAYDAFLAGISPWDVSRSYAALLSELSGDDRRSRPISGADAAA